MAKRQATSELNHDNWDAEEEAEEPGRFNTVLPSELQNRVIRKAKRTLGNRETATNASPFAKFSGFSSSTFSFSSKQPQDRQSSFSMEPAKSEKKQNGNSETSQEKVDEKTDTVASINKGKASTRSIEYYRQLQGLNEGVLKWMQLHLSKNPCCDFTPVFNDYKKHLDTLNVTYPVQKKPVSSPNVKSSTDNFSFKIPTSQLSGPSTKLNRSKESSFTKFNHGTEKDSEETDYGAHFASNTTNTQTFSFGIKLTPTATSSGSPMGPTSSTKDNDSQNEKTSTPFTFGIKSNQATDSEASKSTFFSLQSVEKSSQKEGSEEGEYVPPKNAFTPVSEEDALYSKRCKLFFKKDGNFTERGVGTLYLKSLDGKTQLLIRADTSLGNILLNIMLSASLPISKTGKNNVLLVCVPNPPLNPKKPDSKEAIPILIRVKTSEDADELLDQFNKHKS